MASQRCSCSANSLWLLCAKLCRSMLAPDRKPLAGLVEVDGTEIVCAARSDHRLQVSDYSAASLHSFLAPNLVPGATAKTDGWSGYPCASGLTHDPHVVGKMAAHIVLPWVHRNLSNLMPDLNSS